MAGESVDPLDVQLEDSDLLGEVELTAALIVAANQADGHLTDDEIDQVLGVLPRTSGASEPSQPE